MILDHHQARLWADHGPAWNGFVVGAVQQQRTGVKTMIEHNIEHLRRLALAIAALVVSTAFVGVAVLPAIIGLDALA